MRLFNKILFTTINFIFCTAVSSRKPKLCIAEKVLRLAQKHLEGSRETTSTCALQGSISVDDGMFEILYFQFIFSY